MADESNSAWSRKYRPSSFDEYMGDNVKNLVLNRFKDRKNIPNTIMLYGTRGTGKTSMARLMAKEIHCMSPVDGHSCGECEMCQEIDRYITSTEAGAECFGVTEVDAATTNGKDSINDIIDDALIAPLYPLEHKILILDECHMLSKAAQNSILKVVEEPPPHLVFILCTTDPEQVIPTIHSRMQLKIEVRKKSVDELANRLLEIAKLENLETSMDALRIIAKKGDRVPRECINILESVAMNNGGVVTLETIKHSLDTVSTEIYIQFFNAANSSLEDVLNFNKLLKDKDISAKKFIQGLTRFTLDACYAKYDIDAEDQTVEFFKQAKELFKIYGSSEIDTLLQVVESVYRAIDDDDTKSELLITTTAIRIGKIGILAQGLGNETQKAEKENEASLVAYKKHLQEDEQKRSERVRSYGPVKEALSNVFKNMTDVKVDNNIIQEIGLTSNTSTQQKDNKEFMSEDAINKLLED